MLTIVYSDGLGKLREINVRPINIRPSVVLARLELFRNGVGGVLREAAPYR